MLVSLVAYVLCGAVAGVLAGLLGVGGGIVAIVPHEMAIAVWSPELDDAGNSLAGIAVLEQLTKQLGRSVY